MKILFCIDSMTSGGKERRLTELLKSLHGIAGIRCFMIIMNNDIHYKEVEELDTPIYFIKRGELSESEVFIKYFKLIRSIKPDIVHCWDSMTAVFAIPSCILLNIKLLNGMIVDAPHYDSFNKYYLRARFSFLFSNLILGNSYAGINAYHAPRRKSRVIHNGFDFSRINSLTPKDQLLKEQKIDTKYVVGMVATFSKFKDYPTYFLAACILLKKRKDVTFLAIGNQTDHKDVIALVDPQFRGSFRFLGKRSDVESLIHVMDVCVLSTFTEGISNSIMEYMALSKPVVATRGGGTNEILEDKVSGFLVEPSNPEEMASRIEELIDNESLRNSMGRAGNEKVRTDFTIEKMVQEFLKLYQDLSGIKISA